MDKENVVYTHNGILLNKEKNEIVKIASKLIELEEFYSMRPARIRKANVICCPRV